VTRNPRIFFLFLDTLCILAALSLSSWIMLPPDLEVFADYTGASTFTVFIFLLAFYMFDCYKIGREDFRDSLIRVLLAVIIGIVGAGFTFYAFEHWRFPRMTFVVQMLATLTLALSWRAIYYRLHTRAASAQERIILFGSQGMERALSVLKEYSPQDQVIGYVGEDAASPARPRLGGLADIFTVLAGHQGAKVIILEARGLDQDLAARLFAAKLHGLKVEDMRGLYERLTARLPIDLIEDSWLLLEDGFNLNATDSLRRLKRTFDICFSLASLILTAPLMLLAALLVRLESQGPAIYAQKRVGLNNREFTLYKIRSMRQDAESLQAVWAARNDPRVTLMGRFLRKTRMDELPQLLNVLRGDMSIIGPRPERGEFTRQLAGELPYYDVRHTVKPGITGWAQVCYPYGASLEDARVKLEYDLYYIKNLSALLETKILLKTIGVILFPKGAR
jgi:sugar transferase (PEP-CTERM system associated)